jgi:transaldolase
VNHVKQSALAGADVATIPPATLITLAKHPLTDKGLEAFMKDWEKTGQSIL